MWLVSIRQLLHDIIFSCENFLSHNPFLWRPILFLSHNGFYRNNIYLWKLFSEKNALNLNTANAAWQKYSCENPYIFSVTFHWVLEEIASILQKLFSEEDALSLNSASIALQKYVCEMHDFSMHPVLIKLYLPCRNYFQQKTRLV